MRQLGIRNTNHPFLNEFAVTEPMLFWWKRRRQFKFGNEKNISTTNIFYFLNISEFAFSLSRVISSSYPEGGASEWKNGSDWVIIGGLLSL